MVDSTLNSSRLSLGGSELSPGGWKATSEGRHSVTMPPFAQGSLHIVLPCLYLCFSCICSYFSNRILLMSPWHSQQTWQTSNKASIVWSFTPHHWYNAPVLHNTTLMVQRHQTVVFIFLYHFFCCCNNAFFMMYISQVKTSCFLYTTYLFIHLFIYQSVGECVCVE